MIFSCVRFDYVIIKPQVSNGHSILSEGASLVDDQGRDLALASPDESSILFPVDPVAGHWAVQQREWVSGFVAAALDSFGEPQ